MALSTSFTNNKIKDNITPLHLIYCSKCYLLQLKHNYDFNALYGDNYGYRSGINKSMNNHLKNIVKEIEHIVKLEKNDVILDIASNDGTLLKKYSKKNTIKIGIDPTIRKYKNLYPSNIIKSPTFFTKKQFNLLSNKKKAKIITSIAVFYDVPNPNIFINDIKNILDKNGVWILEQSYFPFLIKNNAYDSVCHEHITYFTIYQINLILTKFQLQIFNINYNSMNGGSIRLFIKHKSCTIYKKNIYKINKFKNSEKYYFENFITIKKKFINNILLSRKKLINLIKKISKNNEIIHIYGASTKGNIILQFCGITSNDIQYVSDRNPLKIGKFTPGSNIKIISEKESRKLNPNYYLVMPWHFKDEFIAREKEFLDKGGKFIFPLPNITISHRS